MDLIKQESVSVKELAALPGATMKPTVHGHKHSCLSCSPQYFLRARHFKYHAHELVATSLDENRDSNCKM